MLDQHEDRIHSQPPAHRQRGGGGVRHRRDRRRHRQRAARRRARGREDRGHRPGLAPGGAHRVLRPRPDLQHRRGPPRPHPRGVLSGAVRGAGLPLHRLGRLRHDGHPGQVADQADAGRPGHRHARGPGWWCRTICAASRETGVGWAWPSRSSSSRTTRARPRASATTPWRATPRRWPTCCRGCCASTPAACWSRSSSPAPTSPSPSSRGWATTGVLLPVDYVVDPGGAQHASTSTTTG